MKKKFLSLFVCLVSSFGLVACAGKEPAAETVETVEEAVETEPNEEQAEKPDTEVAEEVTEDVTIEVVDATSHSDVYNEYFEIGERIGANYIKSGDSEVTEFADWKEAYTSIIEELGAGGYEPGFALIYVNDDDIPELVYSIDDNTYCVGTFANGYLNIFSSRINAISYNEKENVLLASEAVEANLNDYVVAIKDGFWIQIAYGNRRPFYEWAEDSFDEHGNPIISYWEINGEELSSQEEYDEKLSNIYDAASLIQVTEFKSQSEVLEEIDSL